MAYPIRQGDGDPPEWEAPDYAQPVDEEEDSSWKAPDYAKPVESSVEPKKNFLTKINEAIGPKSFGVKKPTPKLDLGNPSSEERIKAANELQDPGEGTYFKDAAKREAERNKPGIISRAVSALTTAPKFITNPVDKFANEVLAPPKENPDPRAAFGAGVVQAGARMLTPVNVALSAIGAGEGALIKAIGAGAKELIPALMSVQKARQAISIPIAAQGAYHIAAPSSTWQERLQGIPEFAGGILGTIGGKFAHIPGEELPKGLEAGEPPLSRSREIPYRMGGSPQSPEIPIRRQQPLADEPTIQRSREVAANPDEYAGPSIRQPDAVGRDFGYNERDQAGPGFVPPSYGGDLDPRQLREAGEVSPVVPPPPPTPEPPIRQEVKPNFVNPFEQAKAPVQEEDTRPLPVRSPNLDPNRFEVAGPKTGIVTPENYDTTRYTPEDIAKAKPVAEKLLATPPGKRVKEAEGWKPPEYAKPSEEPLKFEPKKTVEPVTAQQVRDQDYKKLFNNPDEDSYSEALDKHIKSIQEEVDPAIVKDNYEKWKQEFEQAKTKNDENAMETAGTLRDEAFERLKTLRRGKGAKFASEVAEEPSFSRAFPKEDNLFKGSKGEGLSKKASFEDQWKQSIKEAKHLGIDPTAYDNLDELQWDITKKTAQETIRTGKNPLHSMTDEEPSFAKVKGGGLVIDTDIKRATQNLTKDYTSPLSGIMAREGMQNALDAADKLGEEGRVRIRLTRETADIPGMIEIHDNGAGLDETGLSEKLVRLFASGKSEEAGATGGKGIGSASYIAGGQHFEIKTVAVDSVDGKKYQITAGGTPDQFQDPERGSDYERIEVPEETPTGTSIKVRLKPEQDVYHSRNMINKIIEHTRERSSQIIFDPYGNIGKDISQLEGSKYGATKSQFKSSKDDKLIGDYELNNNEIKIQVPPHDPNIERSDVDIHYLNNGMYQFSDSIYTSEPTKGLPENVIVNIHPLVDEMHDDYPFINTREDLKKDIRLNIKKFIEENLTKPALNKKKNRTQELYNSLSGIKVQGTERKALFYDPGDRLAPMERKNFENNATVKNLIKSFDDIIADILGRVGRNNWDERLEGVGMSLDEGSHGVHIPDPSSGRSSILINPFIRIGRETPKDAAFQDTITMLHEVAHIGKESHEDFDWNEQDIRDPRFSKYLSAYQKQIIRHSDPTYQNTGHQMDFVHRLGEVFAKFGVEATFDAADRLEELYTDGSETGEYSPQVQRLLHIYEESRGREATTEDLLSPTGVKQEGEEPSFSRRDKSDGEGATPEAVDKLFRALQDAKTNMVDQEAINKQERARRFSDFVSVKQGGAAGAARSLGKLRGQFEKVNPGERLNLEQKDTDALFTEIKKANITPGEQARGYTALFKLLNGDGTPQRNELRVLDDVFGGGFSDKIIEMHGGIGAAGLKLAKVANTMKSLENAMSLAAPLRHGIGLIYRKEFGPAFKDMFRFFANKDTYNAGMQAITERPNYLLKREAGLFTAKPGSLLSSEEEFLNSYAGQIPIARNMVGASQRGYVGFLNKLRDDTSEAMLKRAEDLGYKPSTTVGQGDKAVEIPTKETKAIMRFVNVFSGRGELPFGLEKMTNELNILMWSPRMMASRIQMFTDPSLYMNLPKGMRLEGLKSLLAVAALGTMIDTALAYAGAKISYNILSTDFGKSRFGTKLMDPWGGLQQYVVGAARFLAGKTDNPMPTSRLEIAGRFLANKESPAASLAHTLLTAKKFTGKSDDPTTAGNFIDQYGNKTSIQGELGKRFLPIFVQDIKDLADSDKDWSKDIGLDLIMGAGSLTGMAQSYPERKSGLKLRGMKTNTLKPLH